MISQSSSEQNICLVVQGDHSTKVTKALENELELELVKGLVDKIKLEKNYSIVSLVGERMAGCPGISGRLFSILGEAGINVKMIAQGSSEVNISFMIPNENVSKQWFKFTKDFAYETKSGFDIGRIWSSS